MKKAGFVLILLILAASSFAEESAELSFYIEGTAVIPEHRSFFAENFRMEADSLGYIVRDDKRQAGYTFRFEVIPNVIVFDDGTTEPAPPDEAQFVIMITLTRNWDEYQIVSFSSDFSDLGEMYELNQFLFFKAAVNCISDDAPSGVVINEEWQNKALYLRFSFDFPVNFYRADETIDLADKTKLEDDASGYLSPINNLVYALPGFTLGLEYQILNSLSAEASLHIGIQKLLAQEPTEPVTENMFLDIAFGFQLMFPFKFPNLILSPYFSYSYQLGKLISIDITNTEHIVEPAEQAVGFGMQIGTLGGKRGNPFIYIGYTFYWADVLISEDLLNPHGSWSRPENAAAEGDAVGYRYKRSTINLGLGFKFGFIDRKR